MSTEVKIWFSAGELSRLGGKSIASLPKTLQGCKWRANSEGWVKREVPGKGGPGGLRTEYQPPADVLALIHTFLQQNPEFFGKERLASRRAKAVPAAGQLVDHKVAQPQGAYSVPDVAIPSQDAPVVWSEVVIRLTFMVHNHSQLSKLPDEVGRRVAALAYQFVLLYCDSNLAMVNKLLDDPHRITPLVYTAYEALCLQRGIAPGADFNNIPWYQIHRKIL